MTRRSLWMFGLGILLANQSAPAAATITLERRAGEPALGFRTLPPPASNDAATAAIFTLVDGERDPNGGLLPVLHDGRVPGDEDQPPANFFFRAGTDGGRLRLALGRVIWVQQVSTYSWHPDTRAPQVYRLYAADGAVEGFIALPKRGTDPASRGWTLVASVDTRSGDADQGGQHGVAVADSDRGSLGRHRYLLFDISRTEDRDAFGSTFFNEIDVLDADGPAPIAATTGADQPILRSFDAAGGAHRFTIDATAAPDLMEWANTALRPVVREWYPKLVAMLSSDGFLAPTNLALRFRDDMEGPPACASGGRINMNGEWFRRELQREALGSVVHEMVHVVQSYGRARRANPDATRTPGWLVEGIADYIRWFLYEPESRGAEITERNLSRARCDASYRITGNFLDWVTRRHDPHLVRKLTAADRQGRYRETLWEEWTGKPVQSLGDEGLREQETRLGKGRPD